jgi:hypothetical protein
VIAVRVLGVLCALLFVTSTASAQVHGDASAQVGVMKRFASDRVVQNDVGFGPTAQLTAHLALIPLVYVGGYAGADTNVTGTDSFPQRNIFWGGARAKGMIPFVRGAARLWLFAGFGYAGVYQYARLPRLGGAFTDDPATLPRVQGANGGFFEVPFGVGASYKLRKPWHLTAELGARAVFGHSGAAYDGAPIVYQRSPSPQAPQRFPAPGIDRFALGLSVGVLIDL